MFCPITAKPKYLCTFEFYEFCDVVSLQNFLVVNNINLPIAVYYVTSLLKWGPMGQIWPADHSCWPFVNFKIEGFHVTSYQTNFASHHALDCHVSFLLAWHSIGKRIKMFRYFLF